MSPTIYAAVPVLRVADVGRTIAWYGDVLGFTADPFPAQPPYVFAILANGLTEIMVRRLPGCRRDPTVEGWDVYLRLGGGRIRDVYALLKQRQTILRPLQRMPYPFAEFEVEDPDGYRLCLGEEVGDAPDLPRAVE
jgi:catechol 2,3-dioxygenase-like lactoylglutathione lyase family enzyme